MSNVYVLSCDGKNIHVDYQEGKEKCFRDADYRSLDAEVEDLNARTGIVSFWGEWSLQALSPTDKRRKKYFKDAIPFIHAGSWSTLVSQQLKSSKHIFKTNVYFYQ